MSPSRPQRTVRRLLALVLLVAAATSCQSVSDTIHGRRKLRMAPAVASARFDEARTLAESGQTRDAVDILLELRRVRDLAPELRESTEILLERSTYALVEGLREQGPDAKKALKKLYGEDFPRRLKARIGVSRARAQLLDGERLDSFRTLRQLDQDDPTHFERREAAELLAEAGFSFANDDGRYLLGLARYRALAPQVLEYLVLNYPTYQRVHDAYATLADLYADAEEWEYAVARLEDLILYHPDSEHVPRAALLIPQYRMNQIVRDDFDRGDLVVALDEIKDWRTNYAGHELWEESERIYRRCHARLALSDLGIARFYRRIDRFVGARLHAQRAIDEAAEAGREDLLEEARELWDAIAQLNDAEDRKPASGDPIEIDPFDGAPNPELITPIP